MLVIFKFMADTYKCSHLNIENEPDVIMLVHLFFRFYTHAFIIIHL